MFTKRLLYQLSYAGRRSSGACLSLSLRGNHRAHAEHVSERPRAVKANRHLGRDRLSARP